MILEDKQTLRSTKEEDEQSSVKRVVESTLSDYLCLEESQERLSTTEFVERLEGIVEFIRGLQGLRNLYRINNKAENDAAENLKELNFLVKETRAILRNIGRLKSNKVDFQKELNTVKGTLEKKTKEEVQEMETVIAIYDKELLKKWHIAKKTSSPHSLENFISNLAGKRQAIEHVYKMALDRLASLKKNKIDGGSSTFRLRLGGPSIIASRNTDTETDSDGQFSFF